MIIQAAQIEQARPTIKLTRRNSCDIKRAVALAFEVSIADLIGSTRIRPVAYARFAAYDLLRRTNRFSYPQIGLHMGSRDHSTIINGIRRCDELRSIDPDFAARYEEARAQ